MPAVRIEKDYVFEGPDGKASLLDLFEGRTQLIMQHFMFDPAWDEGCPVCSYQADSVGPLAHLHARNTTYAAVSRAPISTIEPFRQRMGWSFPWYSSHGSDFNYDFHVTNDESVAPIEYNFRTAQELADRGEPWAARPGEQGGVSVFFRDGDTVLHTWSGYGPVIDLLCEHRHPPGPDAAGPPGRDRRAAPPRQVPGGCTMTDQPHDQDDQALLAFLHAQRAAVLAIVAGLDEQAWHRSVVPSGWTPAGLVEPPGRSRVALVPGGRDRRGARAAAWR